MVFQNYALYPHLTCTRTSPSRSACTSPDDEVDDAGAAVGRVLELNELLDRKPAQLSGGQRQRVAMGRALVRDADAYLFDEPLSNLDAKLRGQMRTEISRLQDPLGITTVYVTHDQIEAMTLGDRVAVLRKGVLQQVDAPRELYEQPVNLFVAGFIGSPPMNFMPATVDAQASLPIGDIDLDPRPRRAGAGHDVLIAGIRPEHFEDASLLDDTRKSEGLLFTAQIDVIEWLGQRAVRLHPVRGTRRGQAPARRAGHRARQRADPHPARRDPRRRDPGEAGRRRRAVARPHPDAPLRPRVGRQPHARSWRRRTFPRAGVTASRPPLRDARAGEPVETNPAQRSGWLTAANLAKVLLWFVYAWLIVNLVLLLLPSHCGCWAPTPRHRSPTGCTAPSPAPWRRSVGCSSHSPSVISRCSTRHCCSR